MGENNQNIGETITFKNIEETKGDNGLEHGKRIFEKFSKKFKDNPDLLKNFQTDYNRIKTNYQESKKDNRFTKNELFNLNNEIFKINNLIYKHNDKKTKLLFNGNPFDLTLPNSEISEDILHGELQSIKKELFSTNFNPTLITNIGNGENNTNIGKEYKLSINNPNENEINSFSTELDGNQDKNGFFSSSTDFGGNTYKNTLFSTKYEWNSKEKTNDYQFIDVKDYENLYLDTDKNNYDYLLFYNFNKGNISKFINIKNFENLLINEDLENSLNVNLIFSNILKYCLYIDNQGLLNKDYLIKHLGNNAFEKINKLLLKKQLNNDSFIINIIYDKIMYKSEKILDDDINYFENKFRTIDYNLNKVDFDELLQYFIALQGKGLLNSKYLKLRFGEEILIKFENLLKNKISQTDSPILYEIYYNIGRININDKKDTIKKLVTKPDIYTGVITSQEIGQLTKDDFKNIQYDTLKTFNNENSGETCPLNMGGEDLYKFNQILSISKSAEIEKKGEIEFNKNFDEILNKRFKDSNLSQEQINKIKKTGEIKSKEIFDTGLKMLENPNESCGFVLANFVRQSINKFLDNNNFESLKKDEAKNIPKAIAETNYEFTYESTQKNFDKKTVKQTILNTKVNRLKIEILTLEEQIEKETNPQIKKQKLVKLNDLKGKYDEIESDFLELTRDITEILKRRNKANRIINTACINDDELNRFYSIIEKGGSYEDGYNDFINNQKNENGLNNKENKTKTDSLNQNNHTSINNGSQTLTGWENINYTQTTNGWEIKSNTGKTIDISKEEKIVIDSNPEALKNLINFHDFFADLNLESVWKYRKEITTAMDNVFIDIEDSNSLSKGELINFSNNLISFINKIPSKDKTQKPLLQHENSLGGIKNQLKIYTQANSMLSYNKTHNLLGEDKLANDMRNLGIIGNSLGFQKNKFKEILISK